MRYQLEKPTSLTRELFELIDETAKAIPYYVGNEPHDLLDDLQQLLEDDIDITTFKQRLNVALEQSCVKPVIERLLKAIQT